MWELKVLGGAVVRRADGGEPVLLQRRPLALLALLAIAGERGMSRERLASFLWPESAEEQSRGALRQVLHLLRRSLGGPDPIISGIELHLDSKVVATDVEEFEHLLVAGNVERALALYGGPFLDGFHLSGAGDFERWTATERERLSRQYQKGCEGLAAEAEAQGDYAAAVEWWRRVVGLDPLGGRAALAFMRALVATDDSAAALRHARVHATVVREELDAEPDPAVTAYASSLRDRTVATAEVSRTDAVAIELVRLDSRKTREPLTMATLSPSQTTAPIDDTDESQHAIVASLTADRVYRPYLVAPTPAGGGRRVRLGLARVGIVLLVGLSVFFVWRRVDSASSVITPGLVRLAVLPFETEGDTANDYFATGIADEIRGKLAQLPALRLTASTSSNQYQHTHKTAEQIGRELGVHYLLTGRVQWEHGPTGARRVRVSPELIEVRDGAAPETKWQQSYDTTLADVFDVQAVVATRVADKLGLLLGPPAQSQLSVRPTQNLDAYDAYLRSMALDGNDPATVRRSLAAAEQAVALDSGFASASARASTQRTFLYFLSIPTRTDAEAARRAAERAVALAPTAPEGYLARGFYNLIITNDMAAAREAYETALRLAPSSPEANRGLAVTEASAGQWAAALGHARQAAVLDPRSAVAADRLSRLLLRLRRYPEARAAAERGLTFAPSELALIQDRAMSRLGEGDLTDARAELRDVPPTLDRAALAAYMADYWDLYWTLDSADRALVLTLSPSAFDDDRGTWGLVRAELYWLAGDTVHARRFADSARIAVDVQLRTTPDLFQPHLFYGLALAYMGQRAAAVREGKRGLALAEATKNGYINIPYARHLLARIYVAADDRQHALDQLDALLATPYFVSPAWLRIDPTWAPLKGDPRFERLLLQRLTSTAPTT